jgi:hypothetical protein
LHGPHKQTVPQFFLSQRLLANSISAEMAARLRFNRHVAQRLQMQVRFV